MPQVAVAAFVVAHGLITTMIGAGGVANPGSLAMTVPSWVAWWPGPFGRSWLFDALHLASGAAVAGSLLWVVAGLALVAAGLGWLGVAGLNGAWQVLALVGAAAGLACGVPTLLVAGEGEMSTVRGSNRLLADRMPGCEARFMPGEPRGWLGGHRDVHVAMVRAWIEGGALPAVVAPETTRAARP